MIPLLFCIALAAPPELPAEADYSPRLLAQWSCDAGLSRLETQTVNSIAAKWEDAYHVWRETQESMIVRAMERTWDLPPGSDAREAAKAEVYRLQVEKIVRRNRLVADVRKLVRQRGKWPTEQA